MVSKSQKDACQNKLLVCTTILSFIYYAGAKFEKISFGGTSLTFTNEGAITEFIWIIWGYYYIRSYQYYKKDGVRNFVEALNSSYLKSFGHHLVGMTPEAFDLLPDDDSVKSSAIRLKWHVTKRSNGFFKFRRIIKTALFPRSATNNPAGKPSIRKSNINLLKREPSVGRSAYLFFLDLSLTPAKTLHSVYRIFRHGSFRAVVYPPTNRFTLKGQDSYTVSLPWWMPIRVVSVHLRTAISRPEFIENQGPLIIGLTPIWFFVFGRISELTLRMQ